MQNLFHIGNICSSHTNQLVPKEYEIGLEDMEACIATVNPSLTADEVNETAKRKMLEWDVTGEGKTVTFAGFIQVQPFFIAVCCWSQCDRLRYRYNHSNEYTLAVCYHLYHYRTRPLGL